MAIAYESIATLAYTSTSTPTISKPTGLAVGDLMVSFIHGSSGSSFTQPTGWTMLVDNSGGSAVTTATAIAYKVASSGDVAASNFQWSTAAGQHGGCIIRISGAAPTTFVASSPQNDTATGTHTWEAPITPSFANSLLLMFIAHPFTHTTSAYAIATSNPSWTEILDQTRSGPDLGMAVAYANRPESTSTGNFSASITGGSVDSVGVLVSISPQVDATANAPVLSAATSILTPAMTVSATITAPILGASATIVAPALTVLTPDWTNTDKNSSTWTNQNKS